MNRQKNRFVCNIKLFQFNLIAANEVYNNYEDDGTEARY